MIIIDYRGERVRGATDSLFMTDVVRQGMIIIDYRGERVRGAMDSLFMTVVVAK
jgi:hypothetical protein